MLATMGRDLRARRRALGLTQAGVAEAVGTRPVMVGRWERGEALPTQEQVERLADLLDLDPAAVAGWSAVARRTLPPPAPAPPPAEQPVPPSDPHPRPAWVSRFSNLLATLHARSAPTPDGENAVFPVPGPRLPYESYLDDPIEQRRYALRWALTLLVLGALAVGLVWALGALQEGWGAFLDLFRSRPPGSGLTRAVDLSLLW